MLWKKYLIKQDFFTECKLNLLKNIKKEAQLNARYGFAGILNGAFGLSTIYLLTYYQINPNIVNLMGFAVGITVGFIASRFFVFRSTDKIKSQLMRYLFSFILCYLANILMLNICLRIMLLEPIFAQMIAVFIYIFLMYLASRFFIFTDKEL